MKNKRKGFTLVELLIVIVVIGILSAMMMLSSTEAVTSAKASNIVSNLRNLKTAALAYYADNLDYFSKTPTAAISRDGTAGASNVLKYLGSTSSQIADMSNYHFGNNGGEWYVSYDISQAGSATEQQGIKTKLAGRAGSVGLCKSMSSKDKFDATATSVAVFIR